MSNETELKTRFEDFFCNEDPWNKTDKWHDIIYKIKVKKFLSLYTYQSVLDLGCGEGDFTFEISKHVKNIDALDISSRAIERARLKYYNKNIKYYATGAIEYCKGINQPQYDLVVSLEMLYYLDNEGRDELLKLIKNCLYDNGVFYVGLVLVGKNKFGNYFTYESAIAILSKYFKIIHVSTVVPKTFKEIPFRKSIIKLLSFFKMYECALNFVINFCSPKNAAYQANFICVKK